MFRTLAVLVGGAVFLAIFAGIYYAPQNEEFRVEGHPVFNLAPGEVRQTGLQPTIEETPIVVTVEVLAGTVDIYVMDKEWAQDLAQSGSLSLQEPFSYHQTLSETHVNGTHEFSIISDGVTWQSVIFDNSDNVYDGDAAANETANIRLTVRFVEEEERSLTLGYIATIPSILLVVITLGRQIKRHRNQP